MGGDRQVCHEKNRVLSHEAGAQAKKFGKDNDLVDCVKADSYFAAILGELDAILDPSTFVGRCPEQVDEFIREEIKPVLANYAESIKNLKPPSLSI